MSVLGYRRINQTPISFYIHNHNVWLLLGNVKCLIMSS